MFTRRTLLQYAPTALMLAGCSSPNPTSIADEAAAPEFATLQGKVPAGGYVVLKDNEVILARTFGAASGLDPSEAAPQRPFGPDTPFRCASITKMAVAMAAFKLADTGKLDLDADIRDAFGSIQFRNPAFPDSPITLRHLLSHTSTVVDPSEYWVKAPGDIRELMNKTLFRQEALDKTPLKYGPGEWLEYANLNYGLAATLMELATGERFDELLAELVLRPLGITGGLNWAGVPASYRSEGATLYRKINENWTVQIDGPETLTSDIPAILAEPEYDLTSYQPGTNGTLFSPQGGLRISLIGLARLVAGLKALPNLQKNIWRQNANKTNGNDEGGVFLTFGNGIFRHEPDASPWTDELMLGHHGEAYGLYAGAWHLPGPNIELAYAVTGSSEGVQPTGGKHPAFNLWEQSLVDLAMRSTKELL